MTEPRYISLDLRASWLIEKGVGAWQQLQHFAMQEDELIDSAVLLGQELWLPHHETDGRRFRVTLRVALHYPASARERAAERVASFLRALEVRASDERGALAVLVEEPGSGTEARGLR